MKVRNKHGRVGVKTPLSTTEKRAAYRKGLSKGVERTRAAITEQVKQSTSLRALKKELGI